MVKALSRMTLRPTAHCDLGGEPKGRYPAIIDLIVPTFATGWPFAMRLCSLRGAEGEMIMSWFSLKKAMGTNYSVDPGDIVNTKKALSQLGYYDTPSHRGLD